MPDLQQQEAGPHAAGLNRQRLAALPGLLQEAVERNYCSGIACALVCCGGPLAGYTHGRHAGPESPEVTAETVWDLASLTKPLATAAAIHLLAEQGALHLRDEATDFLPETRETLQGVTLSHLLTHTSGLPAWVRLHSLELTPAEAWARIHVVARARPPGERFVYSDVGYMLLGRVVESVAGMPLDRFAAERIFAPLKLERTGFRREGGTDPEIAAAWCPVRERMLQGEVHDPNAYVVGGVAGHAGLFGTLADLSRYAACLLGWGMLDGAAFLGPLTVRSLATNQLEPRIGGAGHGWFIRPNSMLPSGDFFPPDAFGHTGFTGTSIVLCHSLDLGVVLLANRVYPRRVSQEYVRFRRRFHNAVAACVQRG